MKETEYQRVLEVLIDVTEANKGVPAGHDDRILDAEGLALKFVFHAASALYLYRSTSVPEIGASFFDPGSVNVLCRAALETFLVFHYVFVEPQSDDDRDCRYVAWVLAGYLERQKLPVWSSEARVIMDHAASRIAPFKEQLTANAAFCRLPPTDQKKLLKGDWRLQSWSKIGRSAGLHDVNSTAFYSYLCDYAHAGNISVLQMRQADTADLQRSLCASAMRLVLIAMANMVKSYCALFPKSKGRLAGDPEAARLIEMWIGVGAAEPRSIPNG